MGYLAQVIDAASATGAASYDAPVTTAIAAGDTVVAFIQTIGSGANISSVADSAGNTWTLIAHDATSASGNDAACYRSTLATAWTTSSTLTVTTSGASFTSITVVAVSIAGAMVPDGSPAYVEDTVSNAQESTDVGSSGAATLLAWMGHFLSSATSCTISGTGWARAGTYATTTSNSAVAAYKDVTDVTSPSTVTAGWSGGAHTGRAIGFAMVVPSAPTTNITGKRGAIASGFSRYGAVTTADATILALTGKKTAHTTVDGRFGQFTNEYLNFGGVAFADARYGDLSSAAALTAITGVKGAHAVGFSRFGALTTNTRGNLRLAGTRTAIAFADARFGLISLIGLDITGSKTASASADSRFGFLLLHNRTPGLVTVRAENKGLVTIRIGD